ncbi:hypothetical protein A1F99_024600, partial [Pyrenophora tritici-repentis]
MWSRLTGSSAASNSSKDEESRRRRTSDSTRSKRDRETENYDRRRDDRRSSYAESTTSTMRGDDKDRKKAKDRKVEKRRSTTRSERSGSLSQSSSYRGDTGDSPRSGTQRSFSGQTGSDGFSQFPGQAGAPMMSGALPVGSSVPHHTEGMSSHVQSQFPGQDPVHYASGALPGGQPYGEASDYYRDQGQSVHDQPGIRPQQGPLINHNTPHLIAASAHANPVPDTGSGAAADFYTSSMDPPSSRPPRPSSSSMPGAFVDDTAAPQKPPRPASSSRPNKSSTYGSAASMAGGAAFGYAMGHSSSNHEHSTSYSSTSNVRPSTSYSSHPNNTPAGPTSSYSMYGQGHNASNTATNGSAQFPPYVEPPYGDDDVPPPKPPRPGKPEKHSSGSAAGLTSHNHSSANGTIPGQHNGLTPSPYISGGMAQHHQHTGPVSKFVDWWKDYEDVQKMEEYTEYIGVCRGCFDPRSSVLDAPRKHHYYKRRSNEHMRLSGGIEKQSRYNLKEKKSYNSISSGEERRKKNSTSAAGWVAAGLGGIGLAKVGKAVLTAGRDDFDDTYSIKSGRSRVSRRSRSRSAERKSYSYGQAAIRHRSRSADRMSQMSVGITNDKKDRRDHKVRRRHSRSNSSSSSNSGHGKSGLIGAAIGAGLASAAFGAATKKQPSRSKSPKRVQVLHPRRDSSDDERKRRRSQQLRRKVSRSSTSGASVIEIGDTHESQGGFLGGFFAAPPPKEKRSKENSLKKKKKGFFNFGNGSASSSDSEMAFGTGYVRRRRRSSVKRRNSDDRLKASLIGLGATAAAITAAKAGKSKRNEVVTVKENRLSRKGSVSSRPGSRFGDDEWEDLPDDGTSDSASDGGLVYGDYTLKKTKSQESIASDDSGTKKWGWRWGFGNKKRRSSNNLYDNIASTSLIGPTAAGAAGALTSATVVTSTSHTHHDSESSSAQTLQSVYPVAPIDPNASFDARRTSSISTSQPLATSGPAPISIQQPQPMHQIPGTIYSTQAPPQTGYTAPAGPPVFSTSPFPPPYPAQSQVQNIIIQSPQHPTFRRANSSPIQTTSWKRDAALAGLAATAGAAAVSALKHADRPPSRPPSASSNVRFNLTQEQAEKELRERRKEQDRLEEEANRRREQQRREDEARREEDERIRREQQRRDEEARREDALRREELTRREEALRREELARREEAVRREEEERLRIEQQLREEEARKVEEDRRLTLLRLEDTAREEDERRRRELQRQQEEARKFMEIERLAKLEQERRREQNDLHGRAAREAEERERQRRAEHLAHLEHQRQLAIEASEAERKRRERRESQQQEAELAEAARREAEIQEDLERRRREHEAQEYSSRYESDRARKLESQPTGSSIASTATVVQRKEQELQEREREREKERERGWKRESSSSKSSSSKASSSKTSSSKTSGSKSAKKLEAANVKTIEPSKVEQDIFDDDIFNPDMFKEPPREAVNEVLRDWEDRYSAKPISQAEFFAPAELLHNDNLPKVHAPNPNEGAPDLHTYYAHEDYPTSQPIVPPYPPSYAFTATKDGRSARQQPPPVPTLNLIMPTPPGSRAPSVRSASVSPAPPIQRIRETEEEPDFNRARSRVSWGENQFHHFDVPTPESYREQFVSDGDLRRAESNYSPDVATIQREPPKSEQAPPTYMPYPPEAPTAPQPKEIAPSTQYIREEDDSTWDSVAGAASKKSSKKEKRKQEKAAAAAATAAAATAAAALTSAAVLSREKPDEADYRHGDPITPSTLSNPFSDTNKAPSTIAASTISAAPSTNSVQTAYSAAPSSSSVQTAYYQPEPARSVSSVQTAYYQPGPVHEMWRIPEQSAVGPGFIEGELEEDLPMHIPGSFDDEPISELPAEEASASSAAKEQKGKEKAKGTNETVVTRRGEPEPAVVSERGKEKSRESESELKSKRASVDTWEMSDISPPHSPIIERDPRDIEPSRAIERDPRDIEPSRSIERDPRDIEPSRSIERDPRDIELPRPSEPSRNGEPSRFAELQRSPESTRWSDSQRSPESSRYSDMQRSPESTRYSDSQRSPESTRSTDASRSTQPSRSAEPTRVPDPSRYAEPSRSSEPSRSVDQARDHTPARSTSQDKESSAIKAVTAAMTGGFAALMGTTMSQDQARMTSDLERARQNLASVEKPAPPPANGSRALKEHEKNVTIPSYAFEGIEELADKTPRPKNQKRHSSGKWSPTIGSPLRTEVKSDDYMNARTTRSQSDASTYQPFVEAPKVPTASPFTTVPPFTTSELTASRSIADSGYYAPDDIARKDASEKDSDGSHSAGSDERTRPRDSNTRAKDDSYVRSKSDDEQDYIMRSIADDDDVGSIASLSFKYDDPDREERRRRRREARSETREKSHDRGYGEEGGERRRRHRRHEDEDAGDDWDTRSTYSEARSDANGERRRKHRRRESERDASPSEKKHRSRSSAASEHGDGYDEHKHSRRRSKHDIDDNKSVVSSIAGYDEERSPKKEKEREKRPSGLLGLFSSKSRENLAEAASKSSKSRDDDDEERKHRRRKHRSDRASTYGSDDDDMRSTISSSSRREKRSSRSRSERGDRDREDAYDDKDRSNARTPPSHADEQLEQDQPSFLDDRAVAAAAPSPLPASEPVLEAQKGSGIIPGGRPESPLTTSDNTRVTASAEASADADRPKTPELSFEDSRALLTRLTGLQPWLLEAFPDELPPLPLSRPSSPTRSPEFSRPIADLAKRRLSSTAVPIRFRKPSGPSVSQRDFSGEAPQVTSPIPVPSPTRAHRHAKSHSTEFKSSREFRPLYLVERNRKSGDFQEALPPLPPSTTPSVASGTESDGEFESAQESPDERPDPFSNEQHLDPLSVVSDLISPRYGPELQHPELANREIQEIEESGQATPKASDYFAGAPQTQKVGPNYDSLTAALETARAEQYESSTDDFMSTLTSPQNSTPLETSAPLDDSMMRDISTPRRGDSPPSSSSRLQDAALGAVVGGLTAAAATVLLSRPSSPPRKSRDVVKEVRPAVEEKQPESVPEPTIQEKQPAPEPIEIAAEAEPTSISGTLASSLVEEEAVPVQSSPTLIDDDEWTNNRRQSVADSCVTDATTLVGSSAAGPSDAKQFRQKVLDSTAPQRDQDTEVRRAVFEDVPEKTLRTAEPVVERKQDPEQVVDLAAEAPRDLEDLIEPHLETIVEPVTEEDVAVTPKAKKAKKSKKGKRASQQVEPEPASLPEAEIPAHLRDDKILSAREPQPQVPIHLQEDRILPESESQQDTITRKVLEPAFNDAGEKDRVNVMDFLVQEDAPAAPAEVPRETVAEPTTSKAVEEAKVEVPVAGVEESKESKTDVPVEKTKVDVPVAPVEDTKTDVPIALLEETKTDVPVEETKASVPIAKVEETRTDVPVATAEEPKAKSPAEPALRSAKPTTDDRPSTAGASGAPRSIGDEGRRSSAAESDSASPSWGSGIWGKLGWGKKIAPSPTPSPPTSPKPQSVVLAALAAAREEAAKRRQSISPVSSRKSSKVEARLASPVPDSQDAQAKPQLQVETEKNAAVPSKEVPDATHRSSSITPQTAFFTDEGKPFSFPSASSTSVAETKKAPAVQQEEVTPRTSLFTDDGKPSFALPSMSPTATTRAPPTREDKAVAEEPKGLGISEEVTEEVKEVPAFVAPQTTFFTDNGKPSFTFPSSPKPEETILEPAPAESEAPAEEAVITDPLEPEADVSKPADTPIDTAVETAPEPSTTEPAERELPASEPVETPMETAVEAWGEQLLPEPTPASEEPSTILGEADLPKKNLAANEPASVEPVVAGTSIPEGEEVTPIADKKMTKKSKKVQKADQESTEAERPSSTTLVEPVIERTHDDVPASEPVPATEEAPAAEPAATETVQEKVVKPEAETESSIPEPASAATPEPSALPVEPIVTERDLPSVQDSPKTKKGKKNKRKSGTATPLVEAEPTAEASTAASEPSVIDRDSPKQLTTIVEPAQAAQVEAADVPLPVDQFDNDLKESTAVEQPAQPAQVEAANIPLPVAQLDEDLKELVEVESSKDARPPQEPTPEASITAEAEPPATPKSKKAKKSKRKSEMATPRPEVETIVEPATPVTEAPAPLAEAVAPAETPTSQSCDIGEPVSSSQAEVPEVSLPEKKVDDVVDAAAVALPTDDLTEDLSEPLEQAKPEADSSTSVEPTTKDIQAGADAATIPLPIDDLEDLSTPLENTPVIQEQQELERPTKPAPVESEAASAEQVTERSALKPAQVDPFVENTVTEPLPAESEASAVAEPTHEPISEPVSEPAPEPLLPVEEEVVTPSKKAKKKKGKKGKVEEETPTTLTTEVQRELGPIVEPAQAELATENLAPVSEKQQAAEPVAEAPTEVVPETVTTVIEELSVPQLTQTKPTVEGPIPVEVKPVEEPSQPATPLEEEPTTPSKKSKKKKAKKGKSVDLGSTVDDATANKTEAATSVEASQPEPIVNTSPASSSEPLQQPVAEDDRALDVTPGASVTPSQEAPQSSLPADNVSQEVIRESAIQPMEEPVLESGDTEPSTPIIEQSAFEPEASAKPTPAEQPATVTEKLVQEKTIKAEPAMSPAELVSLPETDDKDLDELIASPAELVALPATDDKDLEERKPAAEVNAIKEVAAVPNVSVPEAELVALPDTDDKDLEQPVPSAQTEELKVEPALSPAELVALPENDDRDLEEHTTSAPVEVAPAITVPEAELVALPDTDDNDLQEPLQVEPTKEEDVAKPEASVQETDIATPAT